MENEEKKVEELSHRIESLESRLEDIKKHIYKVENLLERLVSKISEPEEYEYDSAVDTLKIDPYELDYTQRKVYEYLKMRGNVGISAREISKALGISRSHASAILNEFHRLGIVDKIRIQREVKFLLKEKEEME
ncbi:MAG: winged helix-turn-helix transcriptional regulator [Candidatus Asgardarchaeia archaeon]